MDEVCTCHLHTQATPGRRTNTAGACEVRKTFIPVHNGRKNNNKLTFMDVPITRTENGFQISVYHNQRSLYINITSDPIIHKTERIGSPDIDNTVQKNK